MGVVKDSLTTGRRRVPMQIDPPDTEEVRAGGDRRLVTDYPVDILGTRWVIPAGETFDQASVPKLFRLIVDEQALSDCGTLVHDMLYRYHGALPRAWVDRSSPWSQYRTYTRDEADNYLNRTAVLCGCAPWRASIALAAVRSWWWTAEAVGLSPEW